MKLRHILEVVFFALGVVLFALVLRSSGMDSVRSFFSALSGAGLGILFFYPFMAFWDVLAWKSVLAFLTPKQMNFFTLFLIRLAGESVNNLTPFVDVGGEPVKVLLLCRRFRLDKKTAMASSVVDRSALFLAEMLFWAMGMTLLFAYFPMSREWHNALFLVTVLSSAATFGLVVLQRRGLFSSSLNWARRIGFGGFLRHFQGVFQHVDDQIISFYSSKSRPAVQGVGLHFIGWALGGLEVFLMMRVLGAPISLLDGMMIETLLQIVRSASFFIPGNLGAQEAGLAVIAGMLGFSPSVGVALSLFKRLRQILWIALGFVAWAFCRSRGSRFRKEKIWPEGSAF